ncbi:MAG: hypothetical protein ABUT20_47700, partial [Bacteroidota bacterium]
MRSFLLSAFAMEAICSTWLLLLPGLAVFNSIAYFISGLCIAVIILFLPQAQKLRVEAGNKVHGYTRASLLIITGIVICYFSMGIMNDNPLDYRNADMLPVIKVMDQRFLHFQWRHVYDKIPEIWNGSDPIYLPAMWLPFAPAVILHIDLRWVTVTCLIFVFAYSFFFLSFKQKSSFIIISITAVLLSWLLSQDDTHGFISFSEESVVVVYYFLLANALISENIFFISIITCLCILSRYALAGWVPAFFVFLLLWKKRKQAVVFAATGFLFFVFGFLLPFGSEAFLRLVHLPEDYIGFSKRVWADSPEAFTDYLGFAKFFVPGKIHKLHQVLITLSFIAPSAFIFACYSLRKKIKLSNISLACLKLTVVIFYNFMIVPYLYLFFTSTFMSLLIVVHFTQKEKQP